MGGEKAFLYIAKAREVASKGIEVISFGVGQPDIPTFQHIINAAKEALDKKFTGYTETAGIPELREAIAEYLNKRYNAGVDPREVIVTTGAKTAILLAIASYIRPGDEVIIPDPTYPAYGQVTRLFGGIPKYIPLRFEGAEGGFKLDIEAIEKSITEKTKMIVLNNPHNPTGAIFTPSEVSKICEIAKDNKLLLLVDEIYDNFVYGEVEFRSVLLDPDWKDYILYVNGLSKTFSMTGWRLGYLVVRREVADSIVRLATNVYSCPVSFAQIGGVAAFKGSWEPVKHMVELFKKRRDRMHELLSKIPGFEVWKSTGAFYMFPRISKVLRETGLSVEQFVDYLLYNYGVVVLPGTAFSE
ncbi:MAG: aspartate aminotransferase, partial [Thermoprotei archaeon]